MEIKAVAIKELKKIMLCDHGVDLNEEDAKKLSLSILKIYRLASVALARSEQKNEKHKQELRSQGKKKPGKGDISKSGLCSEREKILEDNHNESIQ